MNREQLRQKLVLKTGCDAQHTGWPCNTCFHDIKINGLKEDIHEYWLAILAFRGDYKNYPDLKKKPKLIKELYEKLG